MILDKIVDNTKKLVEKRKECLSLEDIMSQANGMGNNQDFPFEIALKKPGMSHICEVKKASPSKGIISEDFPYLEIAMDYENGGAAAISVLTEPDFFMGDMEYLSNIRKMVSIPILRKDFIVDEYQLYESKVIGADAVLLIVGIIDDYTMEKFIGIANSLGLSCLVEAHDKEEIVRAIKAGARIIGVNNRDLKTFQVDIENSLRLRELVPDHIIFVSESGITTKSHIQELAINKVDACLIGEYLMKSHNRIKTLEELSYDKD